jgi:hypothetical protein
MIAVNGQVSPGSGSVRPLLRSSLFMNAKIVTPVGRPSPSKRTMPTAGVRHGSAPSMIAESDIPDCTTGPKLQSGVSLSEIMSRQGPARRSVSKIGESVTPACTFGPELRAGVTITAIFAASASAEHRLRGCAAGSPARMACEVSSRSANRVCPTRNWCCCACGTIGKSTTRNGVHLYATHSTAPPNRGRHAPR